jgi:hypothetical protein
MSILFLFTIHRIHVFVIEEEEEESETAFFYPSIDISHLSFCQNIS